MDKFYISSSIIRATNIEVKEEAQQILISLLNDYGKEAFDEIIYKNAIDLVPAWKIKELLMKKSISLFTSFDEIVNRYENLDEIWDVLIDNAKSYELGYNLLFIKDKVRQNRCLAEYYNKVYPTGVEKVFVKLNEDGLIFDTKEHFDLFVKYWERCNKPIIDEKVLVKISYLAKQSKDEYILETVKIFFE